ncbi:RNA-binding protein 4.1-like isoform X2 [Bolinopsis microptera]
MVKLYIGNVPSTAHANDLRGLFEKYGMVSECDVIKNYAFIHYTNMHDANAAIDALDDCMFMGNNIHVEMSKNQNHRPGRDSGRSESRNEGQGGPPNMQMPPGGYNMPGMPYGHPPPHGMPGYGMPPPIPGPEGSGFNAAAAAPSAAYPGYPAPYGMPYPPPPMPMFNSEQFKDYFKRYGCMPPLPPGMYGGSRERSSRRRSRSRSASRSPRRSSRRSHSRSPRRRTPPPREYREYERAYSPR